MTKDEARLLLGVALETTNEISEKDFDRVYLYNGLASRFWEATNVSEEDVLGKIDEIVQEANTNRAHNNALNNWSIRREAEKADRAETRGRGIETPRGPW